MCDKFDINGRLVWTEKDIIDWLGGHTRPASVRKLCSRAGARGFHVYYADEIMTWVNRDRNQSRRLWGASA